jgi:ribonuclease BN (tRNA processing enzyme)
MGHPARLTVLGSGTSLPRPDRASSCFLLEAGGRAVMVDLGPGALHRAAVAGCDLERLDDVLLTHVHPDHCADLVALQFGLMSPLIERPRGPVRLFGHPDVRLLNARLRNAWPRWLAAGPERLELHDQHPGPVPLGGQVEVSAHAIAHHKSSLGYRVRLPDGFVVAFSGDATEGAELLDLAGGAELLVLEAASPDGAPSEGHLTPRRAGQVASEAGVAHLLLTHFYPPTLAEPVEDRVRETFEGALTLAHDGRVLRLSR